MLIVIQSKCKNVLSSRQGFTLVELIVVLVILTILGAITVPALTGWIDKAKQNQADVNARSVYLAAQTVVTECYAQLDPETFETEFANGLTVTNENTDTDTTEGAIASLAGISDSYTAEITVSDGRVTEIVYTPDGGQPTAFGSAVEDE